MEFLGIGAQFSTVSFREHGRDKALSDLQKVTACCPAFLERLRKNQDALKKAKDLDLLHIRNASQF